MTITADDNRGGDATIDVTIYVGDEQEPPRAPARPGVSPASSTSLTVTWTEPTNTGPDIYDYDVQYRTGSGSFIPHPHNNTSTTTTITNLDVNTRYEVQVRATNDEGTGLWSSSGFGTTSANQPPVFDETSPTRSLAENTTGVQNIGDPVSATDPEGRTVSYRLAGGDTDQFTIDTSNGQLQTQTGVDYNFEVRNRYSVTVEAQDDQGGRATITVTIDITDDDNERPERPDQPTVTASTLNSLSIRWTAPANTGPNINDYDVQYRKSGGTFTDWPHTGSGTSTTITSLNANTLYEVQVLARSPEGDSPWSPSVIVSTVANQAPTFNDGSSTIRSLAENTTRTHNIGNPITATDQDGGTLSYRLEGTDQASFSLDGNQFQTRSGITYDFEEKNRYEVIVRVEDGQGGSNTIEVTINLNDEQEPPEDPTSPSVIPASSTSLTVTWNEPTNTGPDIDDYDVQYRQGDSGNFTPWTHNSTDRTATITGRTPGTSYEVQVKAHNAEGWSDWSNSGTGSTSANGLPVFTDGSSATRDLNENTTGVHNIGDPISATDPENTTLTYSLEGQDKDAFTLISNSGQLRTNSGEIYDYETKPNYLVDVKATDGHSGERTITVFIDLNDMNEAPTFTSIETFRRPENYQYIDRVNAEDVDSGDDIIGYTITGGADRNEFEITSDRILIFKDVFNFENPTDAGRNNEYIVEVTATGGTGGRALTAAQTITIIVTDENEPPDKPDQPTISDERGNSLTVTWTEPTNTGPDITDYDVQYRQGTSGAFTDVNHNGTGTTTTLTGLNPNTMYQVRVWAKNAEGISKWSDSGQGTTTLISENQPAVPVGKLADRTLRVGDVSGSVEVAGAFQDPDGDVLTYGATSSATAVATVSVSGTRMTITPVAEGQTTVTVTAIDKDGSNTSATQQFAVTVLPITAIDYDTDDDGLIEIATLAQLDAVRHDLNGDGTADFGDGAAAYLAAFTETGDQVACGGLGCTGYELSADLDFDTNGSGDADTGDAYWNDGAGWVSIGGAGSVIAGSKILRNPFLSIFEGNGYTIANLFIDTQKNIVGFFGHTDSTSLAVSVIRNVGLIDVDVSGNIHLGGLVGDNRGIITNCYVTGLVSGDGMVGGLVGDNYGPITDSYVSVSVSGNDMVGGLVGRNYDAITNSYTTRSVSGDGYIGGLVGNNYGPIAASYATGHVSGNNVTGGLAGRHRGTITASYATGRVSGGYDIGVLVGIDGNNSTVVASYATGRVSGDGYIGGLISGNLGTVVASYRDTRTSGQLTGTPGEGQTTTALQEPTNYSGIYQTWNRDLDSDGMTDDPWAFGTATQYPVLTVDFNGDGQATWQEFGYQLREGPTLTATATTTQVGLSWTAVDASFWTPAPDITYTLIRDAGTTDKTLAEETSDLQIHRYRCDRRRDLYIPRWRPWSRVGKRHTVHWSR